MGAEPRLALLSLILPAHLPVADFEGMIEGFPPWRCVIVFTSWAGT